MVGAHEIKRAILAALREEHGPDAVTERPIGGSQIGIGSPGPTDLLKGAEEAIRTANVAMGVSREWVKDARAEGISWMAIGEALGRFIPDPDTSEDPAIHAFEWVAPTPSMRFDSVTVMWRCRSCESLITDHGPYDPHPEDMESGHVENCARHAADIAAWKIRADWDDED